MMFVLFSRSSEHSAEVLVDQGVKGRCCNDWKAGSEDSALFMMDWKDGVNSQR